MNIRGLGVGPKYLALKHILFSARPKLVLIQESMHDRNTSISYFRKMFPTWYIVALDACGHSGGLVAMWNPLWIRASAYKCFAGILLSSTFRGHRLPIHILNIYAPYMNRHPFWDKFFCSNLCEIHHLMLVGDMNFTLCPEEVWGSGRKMDPISDYLRSQLLHRNFIDVDPSILTHTWQNGQINDSYIAKRIDRVILQTDIIDAMGMPVFSIGNDTISDHRPIYIQWRQQLIRRHYPFKFDHSFLNDSVFNQIVSAAWLDSTSSSHGPSFCERMGYVRSKVIIWQKEKRKHDRSALIKIQCELDLILTTHDPNSLSFQHKCMIADLSRQKIRILEIEESTRRLKSRALWLVWGIGTPNSSIRCAIHDILWGIELFPPMFDESINDAIFQPITEEELHGILKAFSKDKCPRPDGWTIEFYLHFFDLIKHDLIRMIEDSRINGRIHPHTSSTLIALIPKKRDADTFSDFRPISLCNISFKIISKIIAERIKGTLANHLSRDKHAFLKGRNILDVVASTQECIYSMFSNNIAGDVLKIDLQKAYDCLDWGFIRCLLAKIGLRAEMISWIMACIEGVKYAININGIPSPFFHAGRGLRQGCLLAPIIFILAMNSLSLHINKAMDDQRCIHIKISQHISLSDNLFVDDVLLCAMLQRTSWACLFDILNHFQKATGLNINKQKSILYYHGDDTELIHDIVDMFGVQTQSIQSGITYLGFHLKSHKYSISDWDWLIVRYFKKISSWEFRALSLAGRVTLTKAVLTHLSVYWAHLYYLPNSIIQRINQITASFIWGGSSMHQKIHLAKLKHISIPKQQGGWGILDLRLFGCALICRSLWRGVFGCSPWSNIIRLRYMKGRPIEYWLRRGTIGPRLGSPIWHSMRKIESLFISRLRWRIHTGSNVLIGIDPLICNHSDLSLPRDLITLLQHQGFYTWDKLIKEWHGSTPVWKNGRDLNLQDYWEGIWKSITDLLTTSGIHRHGNKDQLLWTVSCFRRPVTVRDIYIHMISSRSPYSLPSFPYIFWKAKCPPKIIHFAWLVFYNKNLTWDNLRKRYWHGPSRCTMCKSDEETNLHMFFKCPVIQWIWYVLANTFDFLLTEFDSPSAALIWWSRQNGNRRFLILIFLWTVWKWRNAHIFTDSAMPTSSIMDNIMTD
eukprot:PITA_19806